MKHEPRDWVLRSVSAILSLWFSWDPSPSPLPTVNHTCGWGRWAGGEAGWVVVLWTVDMNRAVCMVRVSAHVHGSHLRFTHNPLPPPMCCSAVSNGGCHGQSSELGADLFQVAEAIVQSKELPWPLTLDPGGLPCERTRGRGWSSLLRGEATWGLGQTEGFVFRKSPLPKTRAPSSQVTTHSDLQAS